MRVAALLALFATGAAAPTQAVSFITCPVAQDQGPDRDLCFYADYEGKRYGLTAPVDWGAPQLKHKVLVEAVVTDGPEVCGGLPIQGRVSVLQELSPECDEIAPLRTPPAPLPPPSPWMAEQLEAMKTNPALSLQPVLRDATPYPEVSFGVQHSLYFPYDSDRPTGPDAMLLVSLAKLAAKTPGAQVKIVATHGASRLSNGEIITERSGMAERRANKMVETLKGLAADNSRYDVTIQAAPNPTGVEDWRSRRVEITLIAPTG